MSVIYTCFNASFDASRQSYVYRTTELILPALSLLHPTKCEINRCLFDSSRSGHTERAAGTTKTTCGFFLLTTAASYVLIPSPTLLYRLTESPLRVTIAQCIVQSVERVSRNVRKAFNSLHLDYAGQTIDYALSFTQARKPHTSLYFFLNRIHSSTHH